MERTNGINMENADEMIAEKNTKKKKLFPEVLVFLLFLLFSLILFCFHELNHEECQTFLVAKDSTFFQLLFTVPHYCDTSVLYLVLLSCVSKLGLPATISLHLISLPFSLVGTYLIIFKAPFKRWIRLLLPFTFFLFYEYTIISSPYSVLCAAFILLAFFFKERNEKPVRYALAILLLGLCGTFGTIFSVCFAIIWLVEQIAAKNDKEQDKKTQLNRFGITVIIVVIALLCLTAILNLPAGNSFFSILVDRDHPIRNLVYTLFIMPADAFVTDVDFRGLLQNESWKFVNFNLLTVSAYIITLVIYMVGLYVTHTYKKKRYLIIPYLSVSLFAAIGSLYYYQIGMMVPYAIFLMWICFDEGTECRECSGLLKRINDAHNNLLMKVSYALLILCLGMSLVWTLFSSYNDLMNCVWYSKELNYVIENYQLTDYGIFSDWYFRPIQNGEILYQLEPEMLEELAKAEDEKNGVEREAEDGYILTYYIRQFYPEDYYQAPNDLNFSDCIVYADANYISNLNNGNGQMKFNGYKYPMYSEGIEAGRKLGMNGYPDIIIGNPNIVGLMGLDAEGVRYYEIYNFSINDTYKLFPHYKSWQVFIRSDLYLERDKWPFMDQ